MNSRSKTMLKWVSITLCCALLAFIIPVITTSFFAEDKEKVVIVLDPGHGGADMGAISDDGTLYESELNLAIARACYNELLKYDNIDVYMTHDGVDYSNTMSLGDRIDYVNAVGGDILISLHCNDAVNSAASGSEVYVSHSTYKQSYNQDGTELALSFLKQFKELGFSIRGVKTRYSNGSRMYYHEDGTEEVGDYYAVIGGTIKKYGIPGILVEHGFVTGDQQRLDTPEKLEAIGIADARAIVEYYSLKLDNGNDGVQPEAEEAVIITDEDMISASDVMDKLSSVSDNYTVGDYEYYQSIRGSYERLSPAAKTLVDASLTERLYKAIIDIDSRMHPIRLDEAEDSELTINRLNHTISGLCLATDTLSGTNAASLIAGLEMYFDTDMLSGAADVDNCEIIVSDIYGEAMDLGSQVGTGCTVKLIKGDTVYDELGVVIVCDLSGDGVVDSLDQTILEGYLFNGASLTVSQLCAADINSDGYVNEADVTAIVYKILSD